MDLPKSVFIKTLYLWRMERATQTFRRVEGGSKYIEIRKWHQIIYERRERNG